MENKSRIAQEIAEKLDGVEHDDMSARVKALLPVLKERELVVVYPESDDLLEFYGMINDEVYYHNSVTVKLNKDKIIKSKYNGRDCPYFIKEKDEAKWFVNMIYDGQFLVTANIPHERFEIREDGEVYGIGIVFKFEDLA